MNETKVKAAEATKKRQNAKNRTKTLPITICEGDR